VTVSGASAGLMTRPEKSLERFRLKVILMVLSF
jgi:hypothetical protein